MTSRLTTAINFLKDGLPFQVDDLYFRIEENNLLNVGAVSQYIRLENITRQIALKELNEIKLLFQDMVSSSDELREFIAGKGVKFNLYFDYGMGAICICSECNGNIQWHMD